MLTYSNVFKALGDPKRVMIVDMLSCDELCACKILEKFKISQSTLSHHMKFLLIAGLSKAATKVSGHITLWTRKLSAGLKTQFFPYPPTRFE